MLAEFALTPSIFDEAAQADREIWRDQLTELGSNMFPKTAPWPVMISNLYGGSWDTIALSMVKAIKDPRVRVLCQNFLQNAATTLVKRPALGDWPAEDAIEWGREAISSHGTEPIERIVACKPAHDVLSQECPFIRNIGEVQTGGFWSEVSSQWPQTLKIVDQVQALRKLCVHSEFLCLITPHIYGGSDDETDFALALIRSALQRPADFCPVEIEIHTEAPENPASSDFTQRLGKMVGAISKSLRSVLARGQQIRLVFWPRFLDRYLVAGVYTETSDEKRIRSPRWGVAMQHIARKADDRATKPPTSWSLLSKNQLGDEFQRYCMDGITGHISTSVISL
jgi:hypothetical protein